jgi:hypothetical protein
MLWDGALHTWRWDIYHLNIIPLKDTAFEYTAEALCACSEVEVEVVVVVRLTQTDDRPAGTLSTKHFLTDKIRFLTLHTSFPRRRDPSSIDSS